MQMGVRILQASTMELEGLVTEAMQKNPVLDEERPIEIVSLGNEEPAYGEELRTAGNDWESYVPDGQEIRIEAGEVNPEAWKRREFVYESAAYEETLHSALRKQIECENWPMEVKRATLLLVDHLDDRGFFEESPESVAEDNGLSIRMMNEALRYLRQLEPDGVGARDLRDCLMIQLERQGKKNSLSYRVLDQCWNELVHRNSKGIAEKLGVTRDEVTEAVARIAQLNSNPGAMYEATAGVYVTPDLVVTEKQDGTLFVELTWSHIPRLRLDSAYKETLAEHVENAEVRTYLKKCFREGQELIDAVEQRQMTILRVGQEIVKRQEAFFRQGDQALVSLGMEVVAEALGVHISTVSRAVVGKYLSCRWGVRELRSFFSAGIRRINRDGTQTSNEVAASSVQAMIKEIIRSEPASKPYSDAALATKLAERGLQIARRTVTKYREQLHILPASLRKKR